jgi:peptidoglycan/LPS O-acetylase OafA/YrhL
LPNYYFIFDGGYFGGDSALKPLLHLWSLGAEIQFYFFFPFLLLLIKISKNKNYILYLSLFFLISLALSLFFINIGLDRVAFLSFPTRLWQFCLGSLLFFLPQIKISYSYKYAAYLFSLILIFIIIAIANPSINFALTQLLVSFFAFIIIYLGNEIKRDRYFLGNFIFQFLGKISYSLYLVHWPVLVFAKYYFIEISNEQLFLLLLLTLFNQKKN